jgi:hypothetical protein
VGHCDAGVVVTAMTHGSETELRPHERRLDRLLGRRVLAANNRPVGRLEEFRAERRGDDYVITDYVIGVGGLVERLGVGVRLIFGRSGGGYLAHWDQIDLTDFDRPRLRCPIADLRTL